MVLQRTLVAYRQYAFTKGDFSRYSEDTLSVGMSWEQMGFLKRKKKNCARHGMTILPAPACPCPMDFRLTYAAHDQTDGD